MGDIPGMIKPDLRALPTIKERMTFLYVERCLVSRQDSAVSITDARGTAYVPAASLGVLILGPGTNISHRPVELLGDLGMPLRSCSQRDCGARMLSGIGICPR